MSFLAPMFWLGALAISLPIVFHLIRRTTRERKPFGSLMFLMPTPPRLTKRSRLEHILLLALRCAALVLLAFGFTRPFFKTAANPSGGGAAKRTLLLVDTSASMRRANLWADARECISRLLRTASPMDQVALFTFARQVTPLLTFEQWNSTPAGERVALAERKLADAAPGWSATYLGNALIRAAETLADTGSKPPNVANEIIVVSDLQEGSHLDPLQGYEWPRDVTILFEGVKPKHAGNASLQLITEPDDASLKLASPSVRVRVNNGGESKSEQFKVGWSTAEGQDFAGAVLEAYVPPGQSRALSLPIGANTLNRILLRGDAEDFDNSVFVVPPEQQKLQVLYLGTDTEKDARGPLYFLQRAFQETRRQAVQVRSGSTTEPPVQPEAKTASLYVVTDALSEAAAQALHEEAASGKTILLAPKTAACGPTLARLLQLGEVALEEVHLNNYAMLGEINFEHPLFAPFADPRFSDFTRIHFWKYRRVNAGKLPGARELAKFDSGDPALLEVPIGKGRLLLLTSGWQPEDSQLALSTKFVPLLYSILEQSGATPPILDQYNIGDVVPLTATQNKVSVVTPEGKQVDLPADQKSFSDTGVPGVYVVRSGATTQTSSFAVNLDSTESRIAPISIDEFERLGVPVTHQVGTLTPESKRQVRVQNAELENRQKLWRWLLLGTLAVLLIETYLAGRAARAASVTIQTPEATSS